MTDLMPVATPTKRTQTGTPFLSFCLTVRNCERTLEATLRSIRERAPECEIVVVDTCSSDSTPEIAQRYADVFDVCRGPRGEWNEEMYAVDDMAYARQYTFESASGRWRAWADGDDRVVGGEEALRLLRQNGRWCPPAHGRIKQEDYDFDGAPKAYGLEEWLRQLEERYPDAKLVRCSYLYRKDEDGNALDWQERERIVRWDRDDRWRWAEEAHEILVPADPTDLQAAHYLWGLLWVHEKKWTPEEVEYSRRRHAAIMLTQYEQGKITARRCSYLAMFAQVLFPEREHEFLQAWYSVAWTDVDRYRALTAQGAYYARRGLILQGQEKFDAAIAIRGDLPDAYYAAGDAFKEAEDYGTAAIYYQRGCAAVLMHESEVTPRQHVLDYPLRAALCLQRYARSVGASGTDPAQAAKLFDQAARLVDGVRQRPELESCPHGDRLEADSYWRRIQNEGRAQVVAHALKTVLQYLRDNDEPLKAAGLEAVVPWTLENAPIALELEAHARRVRRHVLNDDAYAAYYAPDGPSGYVRYPQSMLDFDMAEPRVRQLVAWIRDHAPRALVLEVGCCDGIVGVPLLMQCPEVHYVGCDLNDQALRDFMTNLRQLAPAADWSEPRVILTQEDAVGTMAKFASQGVGPDVIVAGEIVEHVPDPSEFLLDLLYASTRGGHLLLTTPAGSFDQGAPPDKNFHGHPRGDLGHLRAYTVHRLVTEMRRAGWAVVTAQINRDERQIGDWIFAHAKRPPLGDGRDRPVAIAVPGALWKWNGTTVDLEGMGASEETIVRLGQELAQERDYDVYGPVPDEEVWRGAGYFELNAIRHVDETAKVVISRAPGFVRKLFELTERGDQDVVLWLQDTYYPDLTPEVADAYEWIVCVSEWHKQFTIEAHGLRPDQADKIVVIKNWLQAAHFQPGIDSGWAGLKKPDHFVYASSPDRGLINLLELWPKIRERHPEATLSVLYGWRGAARLGRGLGHDGWSKRYHTARRAYEELRHQPGVTELGMVDHYRTAMEFMRAGVWAYPTDFDETCLHGDSMISIPGDHRTAQPVRTRIKDLVGKTNVPVYCFDEEEGRFKIGTMLRCWETKVADELIELTLDDGSVLKLTPDHMMLNYDREWVRADSLIEGSRLTALHFRYAVMIKDGDGRWVGESRLVGQWKAGRKLDGAREHVDHADPMRLDNRPESLEVMSASDHFRKTHRGKAIRKDQLLKTNEALKAWAKDNPELMRERNARAGKAVQDKVRAMSPEDREAYWARRTATRRKNAEEKRRALTPNNHKVVSIRRVAGAPVYDMEVDVYHNFVAEGVVVHNCCTNALKARAGGAVPVTTAQAALVETAACDQATLVSQDMLGPVQERDGRRALTPEYVEAFLAGVDRAVALGTEERQAMARVAVQDHDYAARAALWAKVLGW